MAEASPLFKTKYVTAAILTALLLTLATLILLLTAQGYESSLQTSFLLSIFLPKHQNSFHSGTRILKLLSKNGSSACHHARTHRAIALGLPDEFEDGKPLRLRIGHPLTFQLVSVTENGTRRCVGGDFYETQLEGTHWMSRPLVVDMDDGTYSITISVDDESFPGMYEFKAVLLFDNLHGLDFDPRKWGILKEVLKMQVEMMNTAPSKIQPEVDANLKGEREEMKENLTVVPQIRWCVDAGLGGGGRWTRSWYNGTCEADQDGRYKWCTDEKNAGKAALLESNGWIYSKSSCSFKIWEAEEAWQCLQGRWLLFWGDSNLQDNISNLLFYILGFGPKRPQTDRMSHKLYTNPHNSSQSLLISLFFNGHYVPSRNGLGLATLYDDSYRLRLQHFYRTGRADGSGPDAIIVTTGPHDANYFATIANFSSTVDYAGDFWRRLIIHEEVGSMNVSNEQRSNMLARRYPLVVLRTAVAPAGELRMKIKQGNPQKMEAFNAIMVERFPRHLEREGVMVQVLDTYDATFPFHFDHNYSDGFHYGREPNSLLPPWKGRPHHYFVDIMLDHMLLNVLCSHFPPSINPTIEP